MATAQLLAMYICTKHTLTLIINQHNFDVFIKTLTLMYSSTHTLTLMYPTTHTHPDVSTTQTHPDVFTTQTHPDVFTTQTHPDIFTTHTHPDVSTPHSPWCIHHTQSPWCIHHTHSPLSIHHTLTLIYTSHTHPDVSIDANSHQLPFIQQDLHNGALVTRLATSASDLNLDEPSVPQQQVTPLRPWQDLAVRQLHIALDVWDLRAAKAAQLSL